MKKKIKKRKLKTKNLIIFILFFIFLCIFIYSIVHIINYHLEKVKVNKLLDNINSIIETDSIYTNNIYTDVIYKKENIYKIENLDKLKELNNDLKGWIKVSNTKVNYPFVQAKDNNYYLTHSFDKSYNSAGWIFEDYRNNNFNDKNTIIYGHGRNDNIMFGSLKQCINSNYFNKDNFIYITSFDKIYTYQIFSIYKIKTTSDYLNLNIDSNFINTIRERSLYKNNSIIVTSNDKLLTLSTCYNNNYKVVLHAKLINN